MPGKLLPTSLVGTYPQPDWLIDREKLRRALSAARARAASCGGSRRNISNEAQDDATLLAIRDQERAGLDIITDGEMRRESYSNRFATALDGVDIDNPGTALDRSGHPNPVPRVTGPIRRKHPVEVRDVEFLRANTDRHDQDHRARPLHHVAAGAERLLRATSAAGDGLRRRGERGDQGPVRRRRRHRPARRALYAGAPGQGARVRPRGAEPRARRRHRHDGGPYLLRLRRDHPRAAGGLFLPARAGGTPLSQQISIETAQSKLDCAGAGEAAGQEDHPRRDRPVRP